MDIQANINEGSVREKKKTSVDYDVSHSTFSANLERDAVYSLVITGGIHTDQFGIHRSGTGQEIVGEELNVSFQEPTTWERLKIALAVMFPGMAEKYGVSASLTKYGIRDDQIGALQPAVDEYNTQCGQGIQLEYTHLRNVEDKVVPTSEASGLVEKL
jgi:hypothetical protein